jgi:hypothetical protein
VTVFVTTDHDFPVGKNESLSLQLAGLDDQFRHSGPQRRRTLVSLNNIVYRYLPD